MVCPYAHYHEHLAEGVVEDVGHGVVGHHQGAARVVHQASGAFAQSGGASGQSAQMQHEARVDLM